MSWIITRRRKGTFEMYMDKFQIDGAGEFREPGAGIGINLPRAFRRHNDAWQQMLEEAARDPDWSYEVAEYLR